MTNITKSLVRAGVSSGVATAIDAIFYQSLLFAWPGRYGVAAAIAAVAGAIANFALNRQWTFVATNQGVIGQAIRYAFVSFLTFASLRTMLWLFIEVLGAGIRIAWLPAKVLSFVLLSYPMQRWWVFKAS